MVKHNALYFLLLQVCMNFLTFTGTDIGSQRNAFQILCKGFLYFHIGCLYQLNKFLVFLCLFCGIRQNDDNLLHDITPLVSYCSMFSCSL